MVKFSVKRIKHPPRKKPLRNFVTRKICLTRSRWDYQEYEMHPLALLLKEYLEQKVESETAFARKNAKTNKRAALAALKRKKR